MCRDSRRTIVLDKREDGQMGWAKSGRKGRMKGEGPGHRNRVREEWRGILDSSEYESKNRSETTFGGPCYCTVPGPKTSVIRLAVQISHWSRFSPVKNRRWFPPLFTLATGGSPGSPPEKHRSACPAIMPRACDVHTRFCADTQKAQSGFLSRKEKARRGFLGFQFFEVLQSKLWSSCESFVSKAT